VLVTVRPGSKVRGSTTGRPIMAALDLLGRRWCLRVLWELSGEPLGFRALRQRCDAMSTSVLRQRLVELVDAGVVDQDDESRYRLTALGAELGRALQPLLRWSQRWVDENASAHDAGR
jgi:DNA-binding HxlR family transcriptional regulator